MPVGSRTTPTMEVMLSPVFPMFLFSLLAAHLFFTQSCTLGLLLDVVDLSRPLHGRVPPPRFSSHLNLPLRGGNSRGRLCPQSSFQEPFASPHPRVLHMPCPVASHCIKLPQ